MLTFYSATLLFLIDVWFIFVIGPVAFLEAFCRAVFSLLCSLTYLFATVGVLVPNAVDICIKGRPLFGSCGCLCFFCCWCWIVGCVSCPWVDRCCWAHHRRRKRTTSRSDAPFMPIEDPGERAPEAGQRGHGSGGSGGGSGRRTSLAGQKRKGEDGEDYMSFKQDWEIERQLSWFATLRMASGALFFAREALICFAASLTLVIPFLGILFVYHAWGPDGQYELSPIITIFGRVDPRRFVSIWDNCNGRFRGVSGAPFPGSLSHFALSSPPSLLLFFVSLS